MSNKTTNFEDLNIINPKDLDKEQLEQLMKTTDAELKALYKKEGQLHRQIRGQLWWWWLFPIFGWIIYATLFNNKRQQPKWLDRQVMLKREVAKKELQNIFNKKRMEELTKKGD